MDIFLAVVLFLVTLATAYLGVHATLHPAETERAKTRYKVGFGALTLVAAGLIAWQAVLNRIEQSGLHSQLNKIQKNTETPPTVNMSVSPPAKAFVDFGRIEVSWNQQKSILIANVYGTNKALEIARDLAHDLATE